MTRKSHLNLRRITIATYAVTVLLFFALAVYMFLFKDNNVYNTRNIASYKTVDNYSVKEIEDASAPIGLRKEYSWKIGQVDNNESCLMFYIVHSYAQVYFDDELIYALASDENNSVGKSPSSNWVVVPLYPSDEGRNVRVILTPVYKSMQNRETVFKIGSRYAVFMQRLKADLPQIILSSLCIIMGLLLITVQLIFIVKKRTTAFDMLYLGCFSLLMGIWRITDTRFSPVMFGNHTAALGYISLSALFTMSVPLLLYIDERYEEKFNVAIRPVTFLNCVMAFICLVCQVTGIKDLRETLTVCHIILITDILALFFISVINAKKGVKEINTMIFVLLLVAGSISDFVYFYIKNTSSSMMFTTVTFLIYTLYLFTENILNINKKAYIDETTKLFNKTRWKEFIEEIPDSEPIGIMMMDLNGLKYANDTLGHEMGDMMIMKFSEILRSTFAMGEFVCRWGGDEFTVVVRNADREKMERYDNAVHKAVEYYNNSDEDPKIYFACGYALSSEFPDIPKSELLTRADERMYMDKQEWYKKCL
ncbi:MAG: GGDEF domain-containing protein [Clostridia bacterium]